MGKWAWGRVSLPPDKECVAYLNKQKKGTGIFQLKNSPAKISSFSPNPTLSPANCAFNDAIIFSASLAKDFQGGLLAVLFPSFPPSQLSCPPPFYLLTYPGLCCLMSKLCLSFPTALWDL